MNKDKKNQYNIYIILTAVAFIFLYRSGFETEKPVFFDRLPTSIKKVRKHINIDIDYEKLPARNEIRLIGRVNTAHLQSETIEYKWTLIDNLRLAKGNVSGKLNLKNSNEITLDVSIKDMTKRINVRLEAYVHSKKVKIGSVENFIFDPVEEGQTIETAAEQKAQSKSMSSELPKEKLLESELYAPTKKALQQ